MPNFFQNFITSRKIVCTSIFNRFNVLNQFNMAVFQLILDTNKLREPKLLGKKTDIEIYVKNVKIN